MSWSLDFESIKHNLIIAMRELRRQSLQLWTVAADPGVGWQSVLSELSIMRVRGSERREERRDHPVPASHQDQPAAQYTESTLTAAKLNKFLLLIRSTTASHTAQSLSSQSPGPPLVPSWPGLSCGPIGEPDTANMILSFRTEEHVGPDYHRFTRRK